MTTAPTIQARIHLRNATHMVEWADTPTGNMQAKAFRRSHPEFKGSKVRSIIQAHPEQIECGTIYELTWPPTHN